jgi:proteasome lid subunit RPN8/RPN11
MGNSREDSRRNRYLISPRELLAADRDAQKRGLDILGIYHSHPDHPARPSEYDREHALPWYSYIIVSVNRGVAGDLASWNLRDDRSAFDREELSGEREEAGTLGRRL